MSPRGDAERATPARLWRRGWYHLGLLMLLLPLWFLKPYLDEQAMFLGAGEGDLRETAVTVGPWSLHLQERGGEEPFWSPEDGYVKALRVVPCGRCAERIRAVFVSLRRPGSSDFGVQFEGNPYRAFADMRIGRNADAGDKVWITAEGWDGSRHQAAVALGDVSPVTARWLADRAGEPGAER